MKFSNDDPRSREEWSFHHGDHHVAVHGAIQAQGGGNAIVWQLYPINWKDWDAYALRHQSAHDSVNQVLGINGSDLTGVDFNNQLEAENWHFRHFAEHLSWNTRLDI